MKNRFYGLDNAKGVAILGMVLSHSFMGTIANWNPDILFSFVKKVPIVLLIILLAPITLLSQMGSMFSFISSICVTLSFLNVSKKGWPIVWRYILMKIVFAFLLRGIEIFWNTWTVDFDPFESHKFQFPIVSIPFYGHTLDCIGFIGWTIPLVLYLIRLIPFLQDPRWQVTVLFALCILVSCFSRPLSTFFGIVEDWCKDHQLYLCQYLASKASSGPFQTFQIWAFGLLGACIGVLLHNGLKMKELLHFSYLVLVVCGIAGILFILQIDDFLTELFESFKPEGVMLIMMIVQLYFVIWFLHIFDNPNRPVMKRKIAMKHTCFLRRVNTLSLTAYVLEPFLSKKMYALFQIPFGPAISTEGKEFLWEWPAVALYALCTTLVAVGIARLWEFAEFRGSIESQLGWMMQKIFNKRYDKLDYKTNIYGEFEEVPTEAPETVVVETVENVENVESVENVENVENVVKDDKPVTS